jgi:hypothetical protein
MREGSKTANQNPVGSTTALISPAQAIVYFLNLKTCISQKIAAILEREPAPMCVVKNPTLTTREAAAKKNRIEGRNMTNIR